MIGIVLRSLLQTSYNTLYHSMSYKNVFTFYFFLICIFRYRKQIERLGAVVMEAAPNGVGRRTACWSS